MSYLFMCGKGGCSAIGINEAIKIAGNETIDWSRQEQRKCGEYPTTTKKVEYFKAAYTRLIEITLQPT